MIGYTKDLLHQPNLPLLQSLSLVTNALNVKLVNEVCITNWLDMQSIPVPSNYCVLLKGSLTEAQRYFAINDFATMVIEATYKS